jgi:hypothetical protein
MNYEASCHQHIIDYLSKIRIRQFFSIDFFILDLSIFLGEMSLFFLGLGLTGNKGNVGRRLLLHDFSAPTFALVLLIMSRENHGIV